MKPFRFSLQAVLTIRVNQERKALEAFALAQRALETAEARFQAIRNDIDELHGARRDVLRKMAVSENLQQMQHGLRALKERIIGAQAEVERERAVVADRSRALLDARKNREVIEKLYHKRRATHTIQTARTDQRALDDFATIKSVGGLAMKWR